MNQIPRIQLMLVILGFFIPEEERQAGKFGEGTSAAVRKFQEQLGLEATGQLDKRTIAAIVVRTIQQILSMLGFPIAEHEHSKAEYGASTRAAVSQFQKQNGLEATGELDDQTIEAILARASDVRFTVTGQVTDTDGKPFTDCIVQAFDRNAESGDLKWIGEAQPGADGWYTIDYTAQLRDLGKQRADLVVIVRQNDRQLAQSGTVLSAPAQIVVSLVIALAPPDPVIYTVTGRVQQRDQQPFAEGVVRAFNEMNGVTAFLGEDRCDSNGSYVIRFPANLTPGSVNLRVQVYDTANNKLGESELRSNAQLSEIVDLTVPLGGDPNLEQKVSGYILFDHGLPASAVTLRLYSRGFGGAEVRLDETTTQARGEYAFAYHPNGKAANLEVRAVNAAGVEISLSKTKYGAGKKEVLNLIAPTSVQPLASEYQRLATDVGKEIGDMAQLKMARENVERQDLTLLRRVTGWDARLIALAATASGLTDATKLPQDAVYGLLRAGLPTDKHKLAGVSADTVGKALVKASQSGIVSLSEQQIADMQRAFVEFARETRLAVKVQGATSTYGDLLKQSGLPDDDQEKFATLFLNHSGSSEELWQKAVAGGISADNVKKLQLQGKLGYLTHNNAALAAKLQGEIGSVDKLTNLVDQDLYIQDNWKTQIKSLTGDDEQALQKFIPPAYDGEKAADRLDAYAADLARKVRISFPTQVVGRMVEKGELPLGDVTADVKSAVNTFLKNAAGNDFKFGQTTVDKFIKDNAAVFDGIDPVHAAATTQSVKMLQRAYQITPSNEALQVLLDLGFTSAHDVVALSLDVWLERYAYRFPSRQQAEMVYHKAEQVSSVVYNFYSIAKLIDVAPSVSGISGTVVQHAAAKAQLRNGLKDFPTMESLFGSLDFCECEHCRSVLSPAAYFVDLLQFLDPEELHWKNFLVDWKKKHAGERYQKNWTVDATGEKFEDERKKPYNALIERRPDLPHLQLTCENTTTALPYIDCVNEILEYYVANNKLTEDAAHDTGDATTPELLAEPQNVLQDAYAVLQNVRYPLTLPFDLWLETVRQFCAYFETPLAQLLEVFRPADELFAPAANPQAYYRADIFAEYLGLSPAELAIFSDPDPLATWHTLYGYATPAQATTVAVDSDEQRIDLNSAKALSRRLGVSYKELTDLVRTSFVNPKLNALAILYKLGIDASDVFYYKQHVHLLTKVESNLSKDDQQRLAEVKAFEQRLADHAKSFGVTVNDAKAWIETPWSNGDFKQVIVLADPDAGCNFDQTTLRFADGTAADALIFVKLNLFVRLWRKLGWTIEETDRSLQAFIPKSAPFDAVNLSKAPLQNALVYLAHLKRLDEQLQVGKSSRIKLLTLWGNLPMTGKHSLYAQLFLTRSVLKTDDVFDHPQGLYLSKPNILIKDHLLALRAALNLTAEEVASILADAQPVKEIATAELTIEHVSLLYRYALLAKALQLSVRDFIALKRLSGHDPFQPLSADPLTKLADDHFWNETLRFVEEAGHVKASGLTVEDLDYLLRQRFDPVGKYRLNREAVLTLVQTLNLGIRAIRSEHAIPADPGVITDDMLRQKMALLLPPDVVETFFAMWSGTVEYAAVATLVSPANALKPVDFEKELAIHRVSYNTTRQEQTLVFGGVLLTEQKNDLKARFPSPVLAGLLDQVQAKAQTFFATHLQKQVVNPKTNTGFLDAVDLALFTPLLPIDDELSEANKQKLRLEQENTLRTRRATLVQAFLPFLQQKLIRQLIVQTLTTGLGADPVLTEALLTETALLADPSQASEPLLTAFTTAGERGVSATFFATPDGTGAGLGTKTIRSADTAERKQFSGSKLMAAVDTVTTSLSVTAGPDFAVGQTLIVDAEQMLVTAIVGNILTVTRALNSTVVASHAANTSVFIFWWPAANSTHFEGYLEVPTAGAYRFYSVLGKQNATAELRFDHLPDPLLRGVAVADGGELTEFTELKPGVPYHFTFDGRNLAGGQIALLVQSESLPRGSLARLTLYPQSAIERVQRAQTLLSKSLQLIQGLALNEREVRYLLTHAADFDNLSLSNLPTRTTDDTPAAAQTLFRQYLRLAGYTRLKRDLAGGGDDLIGVFENARRLFPVGSDAEPSKNALFADVCKRIADLTRRDLTIVQTTAQQLKYVSTATAGATGLQVTALDFAHERGLQRLWAALQVVEQIGVPIEAIVGWTRIRDRAATRQQRAAIAQDVKHVVKARFEPETWQHIAQSIFDKLRQRQRDALVAHIMHKHGFARLEQLFEYFLIDPGMEPVVQTSRIRLAISSVQLFIQRCLLNLERNVHPSVINSKHWQWMKRYRVWEANRKIFLFPENWLEPEFRDDKTHLFTEMEGALLQGDVSNDLVEDAFLQYLKRLEELARLDIVALHLQDNALDPSSNTLHVFGRTYSQPHKYFYRRYAHQMWTPWEPVTAEIEGDHLVPVIWRDRLHLFWVTFLEKANSQNSSSANASTKIVELNTTLLQSVLQGTMVKKVQVQLHWSEYFQGQWSTRTSGALSAEFEVDVDFEFKSSKAFIYVSKESVEGEERAVQVHLIGAIDDMTFRLATKNSQPETGTWVSPPTMPYPNANVQANRYKGSGAFQVTFSERIETIDDKRPVSTPATKSILQSGGDYTLLPCDNTITLGTAEIASLISPIFYQDNDLTFYVEPNLQEETIDRWEEWVITTPSREPEIEYPDWWRDVLIEQSVPDYTIKLGIPVGPDDYMPGPIDELSYIKELSKVKQDWVSDPMTLVKFGDELIGNSGRQELAVLAATAARGAGVPVNVGIGSQLEPGQVVVALKDGLTHASGFQKTVGALNIVGDAGLNPAIMQNIVASNNFAGTFGQFDAGSLNS